MSAHVNVHVELQFIVPRLVIKPINTPQQEFKHLLRFSLRVFQMWFGPLTSHLHIVAQKVTM
jgi:hypothetical protein